MFRGSLFLRLVLFLRFVDVDGLGAFGPLPYWVQLDNITVRHYFGVEAEIGQNFPHGFITTKYFPASFCELGIARFIQELQSLPTQVKTAVVDSLRERVKEHGMEYVVPSPLRYLITN